MYHTFFLLAHFLGYYVYNKIFLLLLHQSNVYSIQFHVLDDPDKENESLYTINEKRKMLS